MDVGRGVAVLEGESVNVWQWGHCQCTYTLQKKSNKVSTWTCSNPLKQLRRNLYFSLILFFLAPIGWNKSPLRTAFGTMFGITGGFGTFLWDIGGYLKARTRLRKRALGFLELIRVLKEERRDFIFKFLCKQAAKNWWDLANCGWDLSDRLERLTLPMLKSQQSWVQPILLRYSGIRGAVNKTVLHNVNKN